MADDLLTLRDATNRIRPLDRRYLGICPIEVERIIGTDSRGGDFDREFRPYAKTCAPAKSEWRRDSRAAIFRRSLRTSSATRTSSSMATIVSPLHADAG